MTHEWEHYWKKKADEAEHQAHKLAEYPELAAAYEEEAEEIRKTFLADAVIVEEDPTNPTIEGWDKLDLSELEKRYLDGDR
jgi:hypothetical protein